MEMDIDTFHHCSCFWDLDYNKAVSGKSDQSCHYRMWFFCRRSHESSHSQGDGEDFKTNPRTGKELGVYLYIYIGGEPLVRKKDLRLEREGSNYACAGRA